MPRRSFRLSLLALLAGFLVVAPATEAKNKKAVSISPKDEIEVAGRIAVSGGPVRSFLTTQHYSSFYLYAQRDTGNSVTLDRRDQDGPARHSRRDRFRSRGRREACLRRGNVRARRQ